MKRGQYSERDGGNPELVLPDIKLPTMDGTDVSKHVRFTPQLAAIPVIILTSSSRESDLDRMRRLGIGDYLVKPLDLSTFAEALRRLLHFVLPEFSIYPARRS